MKNIKNIVITQQQLLAALRRRQMTQAEKDRTERYDHHAACVAARRAIDRMIQEAK